MTLGQVETGLYLAGVGSKSMFWYWEINNAKQYYQEFYTDNLVDGEKMYQEERFDLWFGEEEKV